MKGEELTINFEGDNAFLSEQKVLPLSTFDPPLSSKRFKSSASWRIKIIQYYPDQNRIHAEVISYNFQKEPFTWLQIERKEVIDKIEKITFQSLDTYALLLTIAGNSEPRTIYPKYETLPIREDDSLASNQPINYFPKQPIITTIKEFFEIPIKELQFRHSCVKFEKKSKKLKKTIEFSIVNYSIREEFDAIKKYFANALEKKSIRVDATIQITDGQITSNIAKSTDIDKIDSTLIDKVKIEFIKSFTKESTNHVDNSLYTVDKLFEIKSNGKIKLDTFYSDEDQFLEDIFKISDTKHYKHLNYLSKKHRHQIMKLRFLLKPFSFIFLILGERNCYFIWETLDTEEATYIWHFPIDQNKIKIYFEKVNHSINVIRVHGKMAYNDNNLIKIRHDYSEQINGFVTWKDQLESYII